MKSFKDVLKKHKIKSSEQLLKDLNDILISNNNCNDDVLKSLKESEEKYRKLTENSPDITYIYSLNQGALYWSSGVKKLLGFDPNNLKKDTVNWDKAIHKNDQEKIQDFLKHIKIGENYELEYRIFDVKNNLHWFNDRIFNVYEKDGDTIAEGRISDITSKKEIENKLKESESKFKAITNTAQDAIILINDKGNVVFWNKASEKIFQYKEKEIQGKNLHKLITPDQYMPSHSKAFKKFVKTGKGNALNKIIELSAIRKDGVEIPIELSLSALRLNNSWHSVGIIRDISNRKLQQEQLQQSEERFKNLSKLTFEGIVFHVNTNITDCNESFLKLTGYSREEIIGCNVLKLIHPFYQSMVTEYIINKISKTYEIVIIRKNGKEVPIEIVARNFTVNKKNIRVAAFRDITERKKAEIELVESEKKYRLLFENMKEAFALNEIITDKNNKPIDYRFIDINPEFEKLTGLKKEDIINKTVLEILPNIEKEWIEKYGSVALTGKSIHFENYSQELEKHYDTLAFCPQKNQFAVIFQDITERKKTEEELKENNIQLKDLNATKDKFFSIIAHDLRGPVNNIVGFSDLLEENHLKYTHEKLSQIIKLMNISANKTYTLLENLLIWSKSQRDKISFNPQTYKCKELIYEVLDEMQHLAIAKNLSINSNTNAKTYTLEIDKDMFKTIFRNLISNAIKFTNEGGEIFIGCGKTTNNEVKFFVKDTGIGIDQVTINKLFKLDHNITTEGTNKEKGTGLGLILCKEFVEKHGGKIWVESKVNEGSTFTFSFPLSI
ncbi:MAG: PAS domain S-box protein [Bacteroidales bacterium]|nr:PAS domain S-box protein [Bacteroidales bacterium]